MNAHQKNAENCQVNLPCGQREQRQRHHKDFKNFNPENDFALAEPVRKITASHRKQNERNRKQPADDGDEPVALVRLRDHLCNNKGGKPLECVVAKRALKLRHDQRPETATGLEFGFVHTFKLAISAGIWELKNFRHHCFQQWECKFTAILHVDVLS